VNRPLQNEIEMIRAIPCKIS